MSLFASTTRTVLKCTFSPSIVTRLAKYTIEHTSTPPPKSWLTNWVKPPNRPMTTGEYAFLQAAKMTALGLGATGYIGGHVYINFIRPYPARMLEMMEELPPEDAQRLWEREHEPLPPRLY